MQYKGDFACGSGSATGTGTRSLIRHLNKTSMYKLFFCVCVYDPCD